MEKTITCFCEHTFTEEIPETIDLKKNKKTIPAILEGSFLSFSCPKCGRKLKPEFPVHFFDKEHHIDIFFVPEIERDAYMNGKTPYTAERIAIGFPELQEKFKLLRDNLDEKVIELIKAYFLEKAGNSKDIRIFYGKKNDDNLIFYIDGLKKAETAVTKIPHTVYTTFKNEIISGTYNKTFMEILTPPYISINKIRFEG